MSIFLAIVACGGNTPLPASTAPTPAERPSAEVIRPLPARAAPTARGPAPARSWQGLAVGSATSADIEAWTSAKGVTCPGTVAPHRVQFRYGCAIPTSLLEGRGIGPDARTTLMMVRTGWHDAPPPGPRMEGPADPDRLYFVNVARHYPTADGVAADYGGTVSALTATYGAPLQAAPIPDPSALQAAVVRFATQWSFDDLAITVTATRFSHDWAVAESYTDPALSSTIPARAGTSGHAVSATGLRADDPSAPVTEP